MTNEFNADDIFEMAVKIEQNGAVFYRDAVGQVEEKKNKDFLLELAQMEDEHGVIFSNLKKELTAQEKIVTTFDPEDENILYLNAFADSKVFFKKEKPDNNFRNILHCAIQTEKDSIVFYLGIKELVPEKYGRSKIDTIIKEEMGHIRLLAGKLAELY
ncbi:MAG: rubrerythrin [Desulfobacula sp. RIFOXYA12_FULL_46_16]|nr:MAG: rubrerythrin [Desulfobacula sp. RIFOXYA12_FULL_46_16]OGR38438.1 MAG: rubrerythrin [Desulfobacula sp. RIFOXYB2_FULL_45_6]